MQTKAFTVPIMVLNLVSIQLFGSNFSNSKGAQPNRTLSSFTPKTQVLIHTEFKPQQLPTCVRHNVALFSVGVAGIGFIDCFPTSQKIPQRIVSTMTEKVKLSSFCVTVWGITDTNLFIHKGHMVFA